ncbi:hypothetical protein LOK49_LG01G01844 [Camellia lanceoleosa]|uniref:Uncharacterized protein n=1 Tax=Camellia lanceoleosa TaxID=1840588 RepID=A0ACC0IXD2_9ERIC|nr:hypothetical protein LOK49_LG01G01844 [Camellia lanceoleosa]
MPSPPLPAPRPLLLPPSHSLSPFFFSLYRSIEATSRPFDDDAMTLTSPVDDSPSVAIDDGTPLPIYHSNDDFGTATVDHNID